MGRTCRVVTALLLVGVLAGSAVAGGYGHVRDGWMYGLNLGYGWTKLAATDVSQAQPLDLTSPWSGDFTGALKVAFCPSDEFAYGLDFSGWTDYSYLLNYNQVRTTAFWILAQGHWFPAGQGFYVRGGLGLGSLGVKLTDPRAIISQTNAGLGWGVGAGYELRVSPSFALGVAYDYRGVNVGELSNTFDDVSVATQGVVLTLTWYPD